MQLCKVDLSRDQSILGSPWYMFPQFYFSGSGTSECMLPQQLIVTWAAQGNNCSSDLMCFYASFVPFGTKQNRKKQISACEFMCVCFLWLYVSIYMFIYTYEIGIRASSHKKGVSNSVQRKAKNTTILDLVTFFCSLKVLFWHSVIQLTVKSLGS